MAKRKPKQGDRLRAVGYVRASKGEQKLTPTAQREALEAWARGEGVEIVVVYEDLGVSGGDPFDKRPGMLAAIDALAEHGAGLLVVAKRDRLARDVIVGATIELQAERNGAVVVAADGAGNGDGAEAQLMRRLLDAFAEYERAIISARTKVVLASKKARGERTGGIPYGYSLSDDGVHLVPRQDEQRTIQAAKALRAEGLALRAVAAGLAVRGMRPRAGGQWYAETVRCLLRAEVA